MDAESEREACIAILEDMRPKNDRYDWTDWAKDRDEWACEAIKRINARYEQVDDNQLMANAVRSARANRGGKGALHFGAVMDTFGVGSTVAKQLCVRFGYDPYGRVGDIK